MKKLWFATIFMLCAVIASYAAPGSTYRSIATGTKLRGVLYGNTSSIQVIPNQVAYSSITQTKLNSKVNLVLFNTYTSVDRYTNGNISVFRCTGLTNIGVLSTYSSTCNHSFVTTSLKVN